MSVTLSIIIPTYNERENIGILIKKIHHVLNTIGIYYEIIIVDDNSPDGTADFAEELSKTYPLRVIRRPGKLGLSSAVLDGFKVSQGRFIAVMDADLQHPPEVLLNMLKELMSDKCDIVIASRYVKGGSVSEWSLIRRLVSWGAILIARVLLPNVRGIKDPMSGYFMFKREVIEGSINEMNPKGFKILLEVLVKGKVEKVCEIPYTFGKRYWGKSKLGFGEIINYLRHVLNLAPEYVKLAVIGIINAMINIGSLVLLEYLLWIPHAIASVIAIETAVLNDFMLKCKWMFCRKSLIRPHKILDFHKSSIIAILVQWVVSNIVYYLVLAQPIIAQLLGILANFILKHIISKNFLIYHN